MKLKEGSSSNKNMEHHQVLGWKVLCVVLSVEWCKAFLSPLWLIRRLFVVKFCI